MEDMGIMYLEYWLQVNVEGQVLKHLQVIKKAEVARKENWHILILTLMNVEKFELQFA
jgi:hypothetical protein